MSDAHAQWQTLRELDERAGAAKGAAFRTFRELAPTWRDGVDYVVLERELPEARDLREAGRAYASSMKVILLAPAAAAQLLAGMR